MISIVHNEVLNAVEIYMDINGANLLIATLERLKAKGGHIHLYATDDDTGVSMESPYQEKTVYPEIVVDLLPPEAWEEMKSAPKR
jgi:hypothetical protein